MEANFKDGVPYGVAAGQIKSTYNDPNPTHPGSGGGFKGGLGAFVAGAVFGYFVGVIHMDYKIGNMKKDMEQMRKDIESLKYLKQINS